MVGINYQKEDIESIHVHILILVISCNTCEIMSRVRHESKSLVHIDVRARKKNRSPAKPIVAKSRRLGSKWTTST
jgi:hypothetical protein